MTSEPEKRYSRVIERVENIVGGDVNRDLIEVAVVAQDVAKLANNIEEIGGQAQSAVDVANQIDQLLDTAQDFGGGDQLRVDLENNNAGTLNVEQQTPIKLEADDDGGNTNSVQAEEVDTALGGTETAIISYLARALNSVGQDELQVLIAEDDPASKTNQIASQADISGGVTQSISKQNATIYLENTGSNSSDITIRYSPDGSNTFIDDPDGTITVADGGSDIVEVGYDATDVEVEASNTEPFNVWVVER